jgi:hypothetical protein
MSKKNAAAKPASPQGRAVGVLRAAMKAGLVYEGSDKHKRPWLHPGRKGSLCPKDVTIDMAQTMLTKSIALGAQRFAVDESGQLYCAMAHRPEKGLWHGFPKPWKQAPPQVLQWAKKEKLVDSKALRLYWEKTRN